MEIKNLRQTNLISAIEGERETDIAVSAYLHTAYRELSGLTSEPMDVVAQLRANLTQLEELHGRLGFMVSEVRSLMEKP